MVEEKNAGELIYGRHPVLEALTAEGPLKVNKLWLLRGGKGAPVEEILRAARERHIVFQWVDRDRLNEMVRAANHQGVVARVSAFDYASLEDLLAAKRSGLLLLDGIEDPHNLGAILRNAAFFGASGVVIPRWRSAGLSGAALKSSAGALAKIPLAQVTNIAQTIEELKKNNYWVYGADMKGEDCRRQVFHDPWALVIGAEGQGLHRLVKERCDALVKVPGSGGMESLNAASASAVMLYELFARRGGEKP